LIIFVLSLSHILISLIQLTNKNPLDEVSDELLIKEYTKSHDLRIIGTLYERYTHLMYGLCMNYFKNSQEAEDAVMEIFELLIEKLKNAELRNFKAWIYTVSKNYCLMQLRNEKFKKVNLNSIEKKSEPEIMESDEILHLYEEEHEQDRMLVLDALGSLNDEQKRCIELKYLEFKSYEEVAELTGFNLKQVKSFIQNGKRNMLNVVKRLKK
jgi:RNA polymerase sigma factor (sigma-70 family)